MDSPPELERLTGQARRAVWFAYREAQQYDHDFLASVHLLAGLVRDRSGEIATVFREQSIDPADVFDAVDGSLRQVPASPGSAIYLTPRVLKAVAIAIDMAAGARESRAGPAHLLLAMLADSETITRAVLEDFGFDCERGERSLREAASDPDRDSLVQEAGFDLDRVPLDPTAAELRQLIAGRWPTMKPATPIDDDLDLSTRVHRSFDALVDLVRFDDESHAEIDDSDSIQIRNESSQVMNVAMLSIVLAMIGVLVYLSIRAL